MDNIVYKYFDLSEDKKKKIDIMVDVYRIWNSKVNLISRKDFQYFYERHVLHSMAICKLFSFNDQSNIMDLGTGGGFPGIPLAIMFPNVNFCLVDSIGKKTGVLSQIVDELQLKNVEVLNMRAEHVKRDFDFIVSRAVGKIDKLLSWSYDKISKKDNHNFKNGLICLKGGDIAKEIKNHRHNTTVHLISDFFEEDFFIEKKIIYLMR